MAPNEGEKELRRSAPAAASKLRVPTQQKGGEALQKPATTEEDASTRNGQREKRREERERESGGGEERDEAREEWDRGFRTLLFFRSARAYASLPATRGSVGDGYWGGRTGSRECTRWAGNHSRAGNEGAA
jgi:hypothetical protein